MPRAPDTRRVQVNGKDASAHATRGALNDMEAVVATLLREYPTGKRTRTDALASAARASRPTLASALPVLGIAPGDAWAGQARAVLQMEAVA